MSRNIRPGAGAFPPRPTRSRQNDDYTYASDPGGPGYYGKTSSRNDHSRHGGDDDGYYSQSQRSYGAGSNSHRDDGGYPDRGGYSRSNNNTLSTGSTASTNSSSGSSLLDRMKVRSAATSARTSIDDDSERTPARAGGWARKPPAWTQENRRGEEEPDEPATTRDPNSAGNTIWGRLTAATANLTVNVSKAWENGVSLQDGEETPPGGETRLTRALKAYYIERARAPADLPPWLFEEYERRPQAARPPPRNQERDDDRARGRRNNMAPPSNRGRIHDGDEYEQLPPPQAKRGALRDIYDSAAAPNAPAAGRTLAPPSYRDDGNASRATSRLQAMRDAKRLQPASTGTPTGGRYGDPYDDGGRGGRGSDHQRSVSPGHRYQATDEGAYGGYGSGMRPTARSGSEGEGSRQPPPRAAMGLPYRPQRGGGF